MTFEIFQVDAFAERPFSGNPAAVVPLEKWLEQALMQQIALENNLSETAFFVPIAKGYAIRWFTPAAEVDLCGHATLATAHVLWAELGFQGESLLFDSRSGELGVQRNGNRYQLDFPSDVPKPVKTPDLLAQALDIQPEACFFGKEDYLAILPDQESLAQLEPDFRKLGQLNGRGVIVTAPGRAVDFVSRCFFPRYGVDEDPVTGSAHTTLTPYWANRLGKNQLTARQISRRGGDLAVELHGDRTKISGQAVTFLRGKIDV